MTEEYQEFLKSKAITAPSSGFSIALEELNTQLFDWQKVVTKWALSKGRCALFEGTGSGKTFQELEWGTQVHHYTQGPIIHFAPLAVAEQTHYEGLKFGIHSTLCRKQSDVRDGINITNYEMLDHFDPSKFAGVVLDESSCIKNYSGALRQQLTDAFVNTPYKLSCTATPSPNDYMELGTQAEFLGVMRRTEMLATFFTHDGGDTSQWILKGHAKRAFWKWVCSWAIMMRRPSDIGFSDEGYELPRLIRHQHVVPLDMGIAGYLFTPDKLTLEERRFVRKKSIDKRVAKCAELVNASDEQWLIWCDLNDESTALTKAIDGAVEVTGSDSREFKTQAFLDFAAGKIKRLVSKLSIFGWGMNAQFCWNMAFVGLSDSFEALFQGERRCWRFGQTHDVNSHIIVSDGDGPVVANIERKERDFEGMQVGMIEHMKEEMQKELYGFNTDAAPYERDRKTGDGWEMRLGDCVEEVDTLEDESIDFTLFSPPFSGLFVYSHSDRDMGNSRSDAQFHRHFLFLVRQLYRVTRPGRLVAFHCMNIPAMKERDGYIGIKNFRGDLVRVFEHEGFIFHSEHVIWKDPLTEATRTKAIGLMHKQLCKDSAMVRAGLPDYLIAMRKRGVNTIPIAHQEGLTYFIGENPPKGGTPSHERWRRYASPVWMDIDQSKTLNGKAAREDSDTRHICPLQLQVVERALELWSTEDDLVLDPFAGIASTGYEAIKMGRRFLGVEYKRSYWQQGCVNLGTVERSGKQQHSLFDNEHATEAAEA